MTNFSPTNSNHSNYDQNIGPDLELPDNYEIANDAPRFRRAAESQYKFRENLIKKYAEIHSTTKKVSHSVTELLNNLAELQEKIKDIDGEIFKNNNKSRMGPNNKKSNSIKRSEAFKHRDKQQIGQMSPDRNMTKSVSKDSIESLRKSTAAQIKPLAAPKPSRKGLPGQVPIRNSQKRSQSSVSATGGTGVNRLSIKSPTSKNENHPVQRSLTTVSVATRKKSALNFLKEDMGFGINQSIETIKKALDLFKRGLDDISEKNRNTADERLSKNYKNQKIYKETRNKFYNEVEKRLKVNNKNPQNTTFKDSHSMIQAANKQNNYDQLDEEGNKASQKYRKSCYHYMMYWYNFEEEFQVDVAKEFLDLMGHINVFCAKLNPEEANIKQFNHYNHNNNRSRFTSNLEVWTGNQFYDKFLTQYNDFKNIVNDIKDTKEEKILSLEENRPHEQLIILKENAIELSENTQTYNKNAAKGHEGRAYYYISRKHKNSNAGQNESSSKLMNLGNLGKLDNLFKRSEELIPVFLVYNERFKSLKLYSGDVDEKDLQKYKEELEKNRKLRNEIRDMKEQLAIITDFQSKNGQEASKGVVFVVVNLIFKGNFFVLFSETKKHPLPQTQTLRRTPKRPH